jgi:hypothetical protein
MAARGKVIDMQEVQQRAALQMVNEAMHGVGKGIPASVSRPFSAAPSAMLMPSVRSR